jgi:predicted transcriptional regulator
MKLSELIKQAQEHYEKYGDLTVVNGDDKQPLQYFEKTTIVTKKKIKNLVFMAFFTKGVEPKDL